MQFIQNCKLDVMCFFFISFLRQGQAISRHIVVYVQQRAETELCSESDREIVFAHFPLT